MATKHFMACGAPCAAGGARWRLPLCFTGPALAVTERRRPIPPTPGAGSLTAECFRPCGAILPKGRDRNDEWLSPEVGDRVERGVFRLVGGACPIEKRSGAAPATVLSNRL